MDAHLGLWCTMKMIKIYENNYSRIPLSRVPLTRENQLVALAPCTRNFSDAPLATNHMTDPVTHMCWSEQISPLAHSSQATWQAFNLSHCIEMHNTHLLGRAGQFSQTYFTHSAPILTLRNQPSTVNKQWPPLRESRMSRHTRFNQPKNGNCRDARSISRYKYSRVRYDAVLIYKRRTEIRKDADFDTLPRPGDAFSN